MSLLATHSLVASGGKQGTLYKHAMEYYAEALQIEKVEPEIRGRILCNSAEAQLLFKGAEATSVAAELLSESMKLLSAKKCNHSSLMNDGDGGGDISKQTTTSPLIALGWSEALAGHCYRYDKSLMILG